MPFHVPLYYSTVCMLIKFPIKLMKSEATTYLHFLNFIQLVVQYWNFEVLWWQQLCLLYRNAVMVLTKKAK